MSDQSPASILLVDDNPAKLMALEAMLSPLGQELVKARSGQEALRFLLDRSFATVILDVNMPGLDGFETAQLIRGRPRTAHVPIIFVSAINLADADALRGYSLGAVDYITAPIVPEVLLAKVSVFVELYRRTEEARRQAHELEEQSRRLQESQHQLRLAERMAAIGTLSAGLGHDMGNLLLPIHLQLETIDPSELPPDAAAAVQSIGSCIGYLRRLASGLRLLALDPEDPAASGQSTDLGEWWEEVTPLFKNAVPRGVSLETASEPGLPRVAIPRHALTQAVFNLVQNAGDALRERAAGAVRVWAKPEADGAQVRFGVTDDGPGMTEEVRRRCLEPFFTTKTRTFSTGLGLALVHGIVQRFGASVSVESGVGAGSTFSFAIPAETPKESPPNATSAAIVEMRDARLRGYACALLANLGLEANPGVPPDDEAVRLWLVDGKHDLVVNAAGFLAANPARRVLVVGPTPHPLPQDRVVVLPEQIAPSELRASLNAAMNFGAKGERLNGAATV